jgi:hypothetical protein
MSGSSKYEVGKYTKGFEAGLAAGKAFERQQLADELRHHGRSLVFANDKALLNNIIKLVEGDTE